MHGWLPDSCHTASPAPTRGTNNEPPNDPAAVSIWQGQTYDAIRDTGNLAPILLEINGWADPSSFGSGYTPSVYARMTNVIGDVHFYGWLTKYSTDQQTVSQFLAAAVSATQQHVISAGLTIPVIIGEYGNSTTGTTIDPNGSQVVAAVAHSGLGSAAWAWGPGNPGDGLTNGGDGLSSYGQQVAAHITSSIAPSGGGTGCPASPTTTAAGNGTTAASIPSPGGNVSQVASLRQQVLQLQQQIGTQEAANATLEANGAAGTGAPAIAPPASIPAPDSAVAPPETIQTLSQQIADVQAQIAAMQAAQ